MPSSQQYQGQYQGQQLGGTHLETSRGGDTIQQVAVVHACDPEIPAEGKSMFPTDFESAWRIGHPCRNVRHP